MDLGFGNSGSSITGSGTIIKTGSGWTEFDYNVIQGFAGQINIQAGTLGNGYGRSTWGASTTAMSVDMAGANWTSRQWDCRRRLDRLRQRGEHQCRFSSIGNGTLTVGLSNASSTFPG